MKVASLAGILLLYGMLFVAGVHLLCDDKLLFNCDVYSISVYFGAMGLLMSPLVVAVLLLAKVLRESWREPLRRLLILVFVGVIITLFLESAFVMAFGLILHSKAAVAGLLASAGAGVLAVRFAPDREKLMARVENLGVLACAFVFVVTPLLIGWNHASRLLRPRKADARHLVYVVLDGFPAHYLHAYNPDAPIVPFYEAFHNSHLLKRVVTSAPYTHGYFGQLYTGRLKPERAETEPWMPTGNLFGCLQTNGVQARWISNHQNAYPEASEGHVSRYKGLRSYLLSERHTWFPRLLGLDYHVAVHTPSYVHPTIRMHIRDFMQKLLSGRKQARYDNFIAEILLPEMRRQREGKRSTFTLFHAMWLSAAYRSWERSDSHLSAQFGKHGTDAKVDWTDDYHYDPAIESEVAALRESIAMEVRLTGQSVAEFVSKMKSDPELADTTVIFGADHGSIFRKGKMWYGYHPNPETVKVLCAVIGPGQEKGIDNRLFGTQDVTASILDFFAIKTELGTRARSFFDKGPGRDYTPSLTMKSNLRNEWWLVIVAKDSRYWLNIHPQGDGAALAFKTGTYDDIPADGAAFEGQPSGEAGDRAGLLPAGKLPEELGRIVHEVLDRYGLPNDELHPRFRRSNLGE